MQIIKDNAIVQNIWQSIDDQQPLADGNITISVNRWKRDKGTFLRRKGELGLRISPDDRIEEYSADLDCFNLIVLDFPAFTDGRLFSVARILRGRYSYRGELRASGNFIRDQIFFLSRVGVNSFELSNNDGIEHAVNALSDFTVKYQQSADTTED